MARKQPTEALYLATKRHVVAIAAHSGEEMWRTKLPEADLTGVISLLVKGDRLFAAGHGHVYCLSRATGEVVWSNQLPKLGYHHIILAMEGAGGEGAAVSMAAHVDTLRAAAAAGG